MKNTAIAVVAIGLLVILGAACSGSFTTANISELKFGKNDKAEPVATTFAVGEKIYAVGTVSNTSSKHKMTFKVTYDNVAGKSKGDEALKDSLDFEGARPIWFAFNVPLPGEYKVEMSLADDTGKVIDTKSGTITAKVGAAPAPAAKKDDEDES